MADFRGQHPLNTFQYLINTDGANLYNGSGSQITSVNVTASWSNTSSFAFYQITAEVSSSFASRSFVSDSSSFSSASISASHAIFSDNSPATTLSTASTYSITSSWSNNSRTSSYLTIETSSAPPSNTASVVQWINVTLSGSLYKMPLYL